MGIEISKLKVSPQLKTVLESFPESWEIWQEDNYVFLKYHDAYEIIDVSLELNEYGNIVYVDFEVANLLEEIVTPESCHDCFRECLFFDEKHATCKLTDKKVEKEINEWIKAKPLDTVSIEISRTIVEVDCYINIPHVHIYKGYRVVLKNANNDNFKEVLDVIDLLLDMYEEFVRKK